VGPAEICERRRANYLGFDLYQLSRPAQKNKKNTSNEVFFFYSKVIKKISDLSGVRGASFFLDQAVHVSAARERKRRSNKEIRQIWSFLILLRL
jgi:hypothetical protein